MRQQHAAAVLLGTTLTKVAMPRVAEQRFAKLRGEMYKHPQWANHRQGEDWPDLDSTSLYFWEHRLGCVAACNCKVLVCGAGNFNGSPEPLKFDLWKEVKW